MSKVTVVGAGNVGATCANVLITCGIADEVVLIDIKEGLSEGKVMDIMQTANILGVKTRATGVTNDYTATAGSDAVVITSGIPRKPGMTREELIGVNAGIVKSVTEQVLAHSPNAVIICVSNPMDTMTYLIHKTSGLPKNKIIGMGGALDSGRFQYYLSKALKANPAEVDGIVIGGHGDTTVGGATLTGLLGTSAWYAPGAAAASVVDAVIHDTKRMIPCSAYLEGEYGQSDICIGVPCILGKNGIEKVVEFDLNDEEKSLFAKSADAVRNTNAALAGAL